jgi:transcriptional regulator with XRE-family HTH domain
MDDSTFSIGPIMKAARKFKKFNQADVAQAIGCSQSALSKMEHNLLIPSAPQWFLFSRFTSIPPESLETGFIDRHTKIKFNDDQVSLGFKIPKRFRHFRSEKVREIYPFLNFLEKKQNPPLHKEFIQSTGIDTEFFLDFDNLINFQLIADVMEYFIKIGKTTKSDVKGISNTGQDDIYWNNFDMEWKKYDSIAGVLTEFSKEQMFFQTDFQIKVETISGKVTISYFPEYHLKQVAQTLSPEIIAFLNNYRAATLEHVVERALNQKIRIDLTNETHTSPLGARFEVKYDS